MLRSWIGLAVSMERVAMTHHRLLLSQHEPRVAQADEKKCKLFVCPKTRFLAPGGVQWIRVQNLMQFGTSFVSGALTATHFVPNDFGAPLKKK